MIIGMSVDEYYYGDPFLFECYYNAYTFKRKQIECDKWDIGAYVKCALTSTIIASTPFLDNKAVEKAKKSIPEFPKNPMYNNNYYDNDNDDVLGGEPMTETEILEMKKEIERIKNGTRD